VFLDSVGLRWETRAPLLLRYNDKPELGPPRLAHLKASEYKKYKYVTEEQFDNYYKFAFVRNPWDRMVSIYKHFGYAKSKIDFKTFLFKKFRSEIWNKQYWFVGPQSEYVCDDKGNLLVDYIGRYESLQEDFNTVCVNLGIPPTELPYINQSDKRRKSSLKAEILLLGLKSLLYPLLTNKNITAVNSGKFQSYYDNESVELVRELYNADITLFNYEFQTEPL